MEENKEVMKDVKNEDDLKEKTNEIIENLKDLVRQGNVTRIRIRRNDTIILNLPMTVGVVGTILGVAAAPWAVILATLGTFGLNCTVEVEKEDGSVSVIHGKEA